MLAALLNEKYRRIVNFSNNYFGASLHNAISKYYTEYKKLIVSRSLQPKNCYKRRQQSEGKEKINRERICIYSSHSCLGGVSIRGVCQSPSRKAGSWGRRIWRKRNLTLLFWEEVYFIICLFNVICGPPSLPRRAHGGLQQI